MESELRREAQFQRAAGGRDGGTGGRVDVVLVGQVAAGWENAWSWRQSLALDMRLMRIVIICAATAGRSCQSRMNHIGS